MKRILLGLAMLSSFALMAAQANAAALGECGKSYAFQVHGTEPALTNDSVLHYIVGIGQISFAAAGTNGPTGCTVSHLELEYNDNAIVTLNAGPNTCDAGNSLLGGGVPCFDGARPSGDWWHAVTVALRQWRSAAVDRPELHLGKRRTGQRRSAYGVHPAGEHWRVDHPWNDRAR